MPELPEFAAESMTAHGNPQHSTPKRVAPSSHFNVPNKKSPIGQVTHGARISCADHLSSRRGNLAVYGEAATRWRFMTVSLVRCITTDSVPLM